MLLRSPLLFYIRMFKGHFLMGLIFLLVTDGLDAYSPMLIKTALDQVGAGAPLNDVLLTAAKYFAVLAGLAFTRYGWRTYFGTYHTSGAEDLRRRLFDHLSKQDPGFFSKRQIGELMSLLVNDVQAFRVAIGHAILILADGLIILAFVLPLMISLNPDWTWKTLIFFPLVPLIIRVLSRAIFSRYKVEQERLSQVSGFVQETINGIRVLKSFVQERTRLLAYQKLNLELERQTNSVAVVDALFGPIMEFGVAIGSVILIFLAAPDLLSGVVTVGTFVAFHRYISRVVWPMTALGLGISQYQKGMASFSRIREVLETVSKLEPDGTDKLAHFEKLEARNLSYRYQDSQGPQLFSDLNFSLSKGERLGILGPIGSGKTTLVHLLTRIVPGAEQNVWINDKNLGAYQIESLRQVFHLVTQEPLLFSTSIRENLKLANKDLSDDQIWSLLESVDINHEIERLPHGLSTQLGEKGVNLSGGQKQRLCLARGLAAGPEVLILDDVMSAVDHATEEKLIDTINKWEKTLIVISHRLSVLKSCDRILVLANGKQEALGTWSELEKDSATFAKILSHQGDHS